MDRNFIYVLILGVAFMLLFTSFQTGGFIQVTIVESIKQQDPSYDGNGYYSLCIVYAMLAIANWFAPVCVSFFGPKLSMIVAGITYVIFIANFLYPLTWGLYAASVIVGVGAAVIWTAQGNYLTLCSDEKTMSRNSGIFWALLQCSLLWGNIFVFVYFQGSTIDVSTRMVTYTVLSVLGLLGVGTFFFLGKPTLGSNSADMSPSSDENAFNQVIQSLVDSFKLSLTRKMTFLFVTFVYTGLELSFFSGVYGTALGNTKNLINNGKDSDGDIKKYIGLSGMLVGVGEIVGGLAFGILGSKTNRLGHDPIVILGYFVQMTAFFLTFINFPKNSPLESTTDSGYITASLTIALLCSFLLGFGDACYNTQIYSILGTIYSDNSAPAFALFKFSQSLAAACAFFYSNVANLYVQLCILAIFASLGTVTFVLAEWQSKRELSEGTQLHRVHQS